MTIVLLDGKKIPNYLTASVEEGWVKVAQVDRNGRTEFAKRR